MVESDICTRRYDLCIWTDCVLGSALPGFVKQDGQLPIIKNNADGTLGTFLIESAFESEYLNYYAAPFAFLGDLPIRDGEIRIVRKQMI